MTQDQLTDPSLNTLFTKNHNKLWDNGTHSLMIIRQMSTKASNDADFKPGQIIEYFLVLTFYVIHFFFE